MSVAALSKASPSITSSIQFGSARYGGDDADPGLPSADRAPSKRRTKSAAQPAGSMRRAATESPRSSGFTIVWQRRKSTGGFGRPEPKKARYRSRSAGIPAASASGERARSSAMTFGVPITTTGSRIPPPLIISNDTSTLRASPHHGKASPRLHVPCDHWHGAGHQECREQPVPAWSDWHRPSTDHRLDDGRRRDAVGSVRPGQGGQCRVHLQSRSWRPVLTGALTRIRCIHMQEAVVLPTRAGWVLSWSGYHVATSAKPTRSVGWPGGRGAVIALTQPRQTLTRAAGVAVMLPSLPAGRLS